MKIVIGGSYHQPGWTKVCELAKKFKECGHKVLAPGDEWTPINENERFVRFKGQENKSEFELQMDFLDKMLQSDAFVICNLNSYQGICVSAEIRFAAFNLLQHTSNLKQMYYMEPPFGYTLIQDGKIPSEQKFFQLLREPKYVNEKNKLKKLYYNSTLYTNFSDFYSDTVALLEQVLYLEEKKLLTIGLEQLLNNLI